MWVHVCDAYPRVRNTKHDPVQCTLSKHYFFEFQDNLSIAATGISIIKYFKETASCEQVYSIASQQKISNILS
jgi:hypothetical protein